MTWPPPEHGCYLCSVDGPVESPGDYLRRDYRERDKRRGGPSSPPRRRPPLLRSVRIGLEGRPALVCVDVVECARRQHRRTLRRRGIAA